MNNLRTTNSNIFVLLLAIGLAAFGFLYMQTGFGLYEDTGSQKLARTMFIAAAALLYFDVQETLRIARFSSRNSSVSVVWNYRFYMGYHWASLMTLFLWKGSEQTSQMLLTWGIGGVLFGFLVTKIDTLNNSGTLEDRYDLDRPITNQSIGSLYFYWPLIIISTLAIHASFPSNSYWGEKYLLFQMIVFGAMFQYYPFKRGYFWAYGWPRMLGIALLIFGMFLP